MSTARGIRMRRALALLAFAVLALVLVTVDRRMVQSPDAGYQLESATWRAEIADLPTLFAQWNDLNTSAAMRRASPALHQAVPLGVRRMTGVRPTPGRVRLWLGRSLFLSGNDEGWCLTLRPGVALRTLAWFGSPLRRPDDDDFWRDYASAWHGGFLLVASSQTYLDKIVAEGKPVAKGGVPTDALRLSWDGAYPGIAEVAIAEQLPVLFNIKAPAAPEAKLRYAAGWPEAVVTYNAHRGAPATAVALAGLSWVESRLHPETIQTIRALVGAWWAAYCPLDLGASPVDEWAVGLADANFREDVPVVESIWAGRVIAPPTLLDRVPATRQEHRWDETPGWLIPVQGDARAWALAEREGTTFLSSHEQRMPALLATARREPEAGVAAFNLRWKPFTALIGDVLIRAASDGMLPGYGADDVKADILPHVDAFADWGTLQLHAGSEGGEIMGEGWIALGAELVP
ncbi:MAG: hypothetical protein JNK74_10810 [Candidatus Hydrogenedentes bacterium]|nr:hypothetical protein [Candidatus Hydrogenedentota bacterium]